MYLRHTTVNKDGKRHCYWRLVRSVRCGRKVRQETVAHLGELDDEGRARASRLAQQMSGRVEERDLFEADSAATEALPIQLDQVRLERGRSFGDVWLAWKLWNVLQLDEVCTEVMPAGRESVPWSLMAAILVIARLCEPSSELHVAEDWLRGTALGDLLGISADEVNDDRLYRALDQLLPHKARLEKHLRERLGELFSLDYDLLLYDVTSTYFEGQCASAELARRGHSRDHRPDCKQVCIALVVTREGMPLGYEIFPGNRADVTTVGEIVETMEQRFGVANRIWVMDRGMTSSDNLQWLQASGRRYLVGTPKAELKHWSRQIAEATNWKVVREGIEAKLCPGPGGLETFVLCRSAERREKELAMHGRFAANIEEGLRSLERRLARARSQEDRGKVERQIGRLLQRNTRAAGRYQITISEDEGAPARLRLAWRARPEWDDWARLSEGCYVLRTNVNDWSPEELWRTYVQLSEAEAAFRIHKSELSMRPIWHRKKQRIEAHILVCFLAYVLWKTLEQWQQRAGLGNSPRTVLGELARIQSADVVLPVAGTTRREVTIRCVVRPDRSQAVLLDRLGLRLPERLKLAPTAPQM